MQFLLCLVATGFFLALASMTSAQATEKRRTGNVCQEDRDCPGNAFCRQNSYCVCKSEFVYVANNDLTKSCLKVGMHGDPCIQDVQCSTMMGLHSECLAGTCACLPGTQLVEDRCYKTSAIGERCMVDHNCYLAGALEDPESQSFCIRGYCTCQLHYSPRDNGTRCVRDANLGEPCEDQEQCADVGLECQHGTCRCKDGWVGHNKTNICVQTVSALDELCEFDVQCEHLAGIKDKDPRTPAAALCMGGACSCSYSAREAGTPPRCWNFKRPGQQCVRDEECLPEENEPGFCRSGRCTCKNCVPDARDFGGASIANPISLISAILLSVAIFKMDAILA